MMHPPQRKHPIHGIMYAWEGLDLIMLRCEMDVDATRLEHALDNAGPDVSDQRRKYTADMVSNLRLAVIALMDLESERNIAINNATSEKIAHARTINALDEANAKIKQLTIEGDNLRRALQQRMST